MPRYNVYGPILTHIKWRAHRKHVHPLRGACIRKCVHNEVHLHSSRLNWTCIIFSKMSCMIFVDQSHDLSTWQLHKHMEGVVTLECYKSSYTPLNSTEHRMFFLFLSKIVQFGWLYLQIRIFFCFFRVGPQHFLNIWSMMRGPPFCCL